MAIEYKCGKDTIEKVLKKMKNHRIISEKAEFNHSAEKQLRMEVTYRDLDFLQRLGRIDEVKTVNTILELLKSKGFISETASYNKELFEQFRKDIKLKFKVPWTSITPVMERLLYMLSSVKKPEIIFAAGIYCGNTLAWNVGPGFGKYQSYIFNKAFGIEIEQQSIEIAKSNFKKLQNSDNIELICDDALKIAERLDENIDYIYLDADCEKTGKRIYLDILKILYPKLKKDGWVLAHDSTEWCFEEDLREYKAFVRNKTNFNESFCFDIDSYGLELSIK